MLVSRELNIQILFETKFRLNTVRCFFFNVSPHRYHTLLIVSVHQSSEVEILMPNEKCSF